MTAKELQEQIDALLVQIATLQDQLSDMKDTDVLSPVVVRNKNYQDLVDLAEGAFLKAEYLEAFLIQSCIIEGVLKEYAKKKLSSVISQSTILGKKFENFELARFIDELFISGKIEKTLYENLNRYRKQRNDVIHHLLEYEDKGKLTEELKEVYKLGKHMKGFIVDDMNSEMQGGLTVAALDAQINTLLSQIKELQSQLGGSNNP